MKNLLLILSVIVSVVKVGAQELPPAVFLNKITARLTGANPRPEDYDALLKEMKAKSCQSVTCLDGFFREYIRQKMNQPEFYALFYGEVTERMGYMSPATAILSQIAKSGDRNGNASTGRDFMLVYRTLKENLPIDNLFTSQIITDPVYLTGGVSAGNSAYSRMGIDTSQLPSGSGTQTDYSWKTETGASAPAVEFNLKGHANISGLFASTNFLTRYWNGENNKNRKRAATFLRVMMCETMVPAIEAEKEEEKEIQIALGKTTEDALTAEVKRIHKNMQDRHASDKDCAACHSRLDPIGRVMRSMEVGFSGESIRATVLFPTTSHEVKEVPVSNFHDLAMKTTKEPKFLECQINWMVEAFLGNNLKITPQRLVEISEIVEKKQRRVKTMIEDLLMIPEFRGLEQKVIEPPSLVAAKTILSNCNDCHKGRIFEKRPEEIRSIVDRVAVCLDMPNDGRTLEMPPSDHYWFPSVQEVIAVKKWIGEGAPISDKVKLYQRAEVDQLFSQKREVPKCRELKAKF